ncbi:MAG: radical SAM protein [Mailhella sp.]|nr:radical SAM protein [Mailhella sp.]
MSRFSCVASPFSHSRTVFFKVGARQKRAKRVVPVFLPFSGCPMQCVFCAQDKQTGSSAPAPIPAILEDAEARLSVMPSCSESGSRELAFYGGTFTALPAEKRSVCLDFLRRMQDADLITHARCSTRPDALSPAILAELKQYDITLIELGIQSFDSEALRTSRRGYDGELALDACRRIVDAGFELGIQLLPGMPGTSPDIFLQDVETALSLSPSCLRFYPCLVPDGTVLARWFREGRYQPWSLDDTVRTLGDALHRAWKKDVPVIRLAVAPEPLFDAAVLAGPRHPALGALIQAEALLLSAREAVFELGLPPQALLLPQRCQGYIYGDRGALKTRWADLGLGPERLYFMDMDVAELRG